jgi:hypothetical protein
MPTPCTSLWVSGSATAPDRPAPDCASVPRVKISFGWFREASELISGPQLHHVDWAQLYVDYVYLDTDERHEFAQVTHEYLIEQLQFTGSESIPMNQENVKIKLNFNHPVKGN